MRIYNGDCLKIMPLLPAKSVDMILCDLPYGVTDCRWDSVIPFEPLWQNYKRLIKDRGAIVLTATQPFATDLINSNRKWFKYEWIWSKIMAGNFCMAKKMPLMEHENILVFANGTTTYNPIMEQRPQGEYCNKAGKTSYNHTTGVKAASSKNWDNSVKYPSSIITINKSNAECSSRSRLHPTQKPVELFEYLIKTYTNEGDTVLDNCAGSFTTGVACQNLGRHFIGIELDKTYYELGKQRMADNRNLWYK